MKEKKAAWHKTCINLIYTGVRIRKRPIFLHLIHFLNKRQDHRNGQSRFSPGVFGTRRSLIYGGSLHSGRAMCGEDQRAPRHLRTCRKNFISSPPRRRARSVEPRIPFASRYTLDPPRGVFTLFSLLLFPTAETAVFFIELPRLSSDLRLLQFFSLRLLLFLSGCLDSSSIYFTRVPCRLFSAAGF